MTNLFVMLLRAFFTGGFFCAAAQILIDRTRLTPGKILVFYVILGVFLGAVGVYEPLLQFAGAGASVPLTGFGYLISRGVQEAVRRDGWLGIFTGGLTSAAGGVTAALFAGFMASLFFRSKSRS